MTIQELGAIGEFVGSALTVIMLVYLAIQVNYLKKQSEMQASYARVQNAREVMLVEMESTHLPKVFEKMHRDRQLTGLSRIYADKYGLSREDTWRLGTHFMVQLKGQEANFGKLSRLEQESAGRIINAFSHETGWHDWWHHDRRMFNDDFADYVDEHTKPSV